MITKEQIDHIANLAKLQIEDYEKYQKQLNDIMQEIDKIINVEVTSQDIMISPTINRNCLTNDKIGFHLDKEAIFKNANKSQDNYLVVMKVME